MPDTGAKIAGAPARRIAWTGAFVDRGLEAEFRRESLEALRRFLRFSLGLSTLVFLAYGVHDLLVVPEVHERAWIARYGVFMPVALVVLALTGTRQLARFGQLAMLAYGLAACFVVLFIGAIAQPTGFFLYTSYAVLFVTLGPFIARMSVITQVVFTLSTLTGYELFDALWVKSPLTVRGSIGMTLVSLGGIGALVAYQLERQARESFLQRRVIEAQVAAIDREKGRAEALLLNVLPPNIAERLKLDTGAIAEGFTEVSVLFADIVGFTQMTEKLAPEELVSRLNLIFSSFDDLVDKLKLEKIKTIGDAYMVAGGLHSREYDHAQAIAEMALAMLRRVADFGTQFGSELSLRIGIHTGSVVAGVIGKKKFIYDVWGDTVNTASRMESHGEPGKIQVSEATQLLLKNSYELAERGPMEIKGKGTMRTWFLLGPKAMPSGQVAKTQLPRMKAES